MSLHMSLVQAHAHMDVRTYSPHIWETVKGLISFGECRGAVSTCHKFKDTLPHEVRVPHTASGVSQVWFAALFSSPNVSENNPASSNLQCLFHETRPLQRPPFFFPYPGSFIWLHHKPPNHLQTNGSYCTLPLSGLMQKSQLSSPFLSL